VGKSESVDNQWWLEKRLLRVRIKAIISRQLNEGERERENVFI
jgi:hypothetical protein